MSDENNDTGDRPVVELFVKAALDKFKNGGCPICHRYFLIMYILRERGLLDLVVTTFLPESPPKEVLEFSNGKRYPLVKVHKGLDANGQDITGLECDTIDEIEALIDRFECEDMMGRRDSSLEDRAERAFEDLFKKFNIFIKQPGDSAPILRMLERLDGYLRDNGHKFMIGDRLTRADCYLLPVLQHIRVSGKAYKDFEIPTELVYVWRYLRDSYDTDAMQESCPADREIITHYLDKAATKPHIPQGKAQLMTEARTFSVPEAIDQGYMGNGEAE